MNVSIEVFNPSYELIGTLEQRESFRIAEKFTYCGEFEVVAPITKKNLELLVEGNLLWINGEKKLSVIRYVKKKNDDDGKATMTVKGYTLEEYLKGRCIYPTFEFKGTTTDCMIALVNKFCINPDNPARKIEMGISPDCFRTNDSISYQNTGDYLLEQLQELALQAGVGFTIDFDYKARKILFRVVEGVNKSFENNRNDFILFSDDSEDILNPQYESNSSDFKNVAIVTGEGEGGARKWIEVVSGQMWKVENVINDGSFENGATDWTLGANPSAVVSEEFKNSGKKSLKMVGVGVTNRWSESNKFAMSVGEVYYVRCMLKKNSGNTAFGLYGVVNGSQSYNLGVTSISNIYNDFVPVSLRVVIPSGITSNVCNLLVYGERSVANTNLICYWDDCLVVNLTKHFGAGKEPTKEWCDANIKYFDKVYYVGNYPDNIDRKEVYVDARDIQSKDANDVVIPEDEYYKLLIQRGKAKLEDSKRFESYDCDINLTGKRAYLYNKDYMLGYIVTVEDSELGTRMSTRITEVERVWDEEGLTLTPVFGDESPTITKLIKKGR